MKLLFTGSSGFLGKNIITMLENVFEIYTLGLSDNDNYKVDISLDTPLLNQSFDVILHAAGKAHSVPKTLKEEEEFYRINFEGTKNLCKAFEKSSLPKSFIFISSVAVYGKDEGIFIDENSPLLGNSPYALSKIKAETFLVEWCKKNNIILSILRPSLIAGQNPPGNLGLMINGIRTGKYLSVGNGKAQKSILMAHDIATVIPLLINKGGTYNLCDNRHPSFKELEILIANQLNKPRPKNIPYILAKLLAVIGDLLGKNAPINSKKLNKITKSLTFSNEKIKRELNWEPADVLSNFKISNIR